MQRIGMRVGRLFFAGLFLIFISGTGLAQTKTLTVTFPPRERTLNSAFQGKSEQIFETLEHRLSDAERLGDGATLNRLLSDRVMILGTNWTKDQWAHLLVSGKGTFANVEKKGMRIQIFGDTVIVTGTQNVDSKTPNGASSYTFGFMNTWMRTKAGDWEVIAMAADQVK
ncbi:MAG: nuclear transport factor 2 family protein [Pyrinomonadaceae bacterium]